MVAWVTSEIARAREAHRGRVEETVLRRLNRREYRNTIRDLFGFDMTMFDPTKGFPEDDEEPPGPPALFKFKEFKLFESPPPRGRFRFDDRT